MDINIFNLLIKALQIGNSIMKGLILMIMNQNPCDKSVALRNFQKKLSFAIHKENK